MPKHHRVEVRFEVLHTQQFHDFPKLHQEALQWSLGETLEETSKKLDGLEKGYNVTNGMRKVIPDDMDFAEAGAWSSKKEQTKGLWKGNSPTMTRTE